MAHSLGNLSESNGESKLQFLSIAHYMFYHLLFQVIAEVRSTFTARPARGRWNLPYDIVAKNFLVSDTLRFLDISLVFKFSIFSQGNKFACCEFRQSIWQKWIFGP